MTAFEDFFILFAGTPGSDPLMGIVFYIFVLSGTFVLMLGILELFSLLGRVRIGR